jgi:triacylglycerol lipase
MRKFGVVVLVAVVAIGVAACQPVRPTGTPSGRTPVMFVHGWNAQPSTWDTAVTAFKADGYSTGDLENFSYDTGLSASAAAAQLATEVDYLRTFTNKAKIDIVTHSYGSMVVKYCIEKGGCKNKIAHWMSLAGADNGTSTSAICAPLQASCKDMAGQTTTVADLQAAWPQITAQGIKVEVQWSSADGTIIPAENSKEPAPATNVQLAGSPGHLAIPSDSGVIAETLRFLKH